MCESSADQSTALHDASLLPSTSIFADAGLRRSADKKVFQEFKHVVNEIALGFAAIQRPAVLFDFGFEVRAASALALVAKTSIAHAAEGQEPCQCGGS